MTDLYEHVNPRNKKPSPLISKQTYDIIMKHEDVSTDSLVFLRYSHTCIIILFEKSFSRCSTPLLSMIETSTTHTLDLR